MTPLPDGCAAWRRRIPRLTALPEDAPERRVWEEHTTGCPECNRVLAEETEFQRQFAALPEPGPAFIATAVMRRVRQPHRSAIRLRPRKIAWGLASSLAGVALGFWIAAALPNPSGKVDPLEGYDAVLTELEDNMELLMWELAGNNGQEAS